MLHRMAPASLFVLLALVAFAARAADEKATAITDPAKGGVDFAIQGEYSGEIPTDEGPRKFGVQVIALGNGKFRAVAYPGGLPGDGWSKGNDKHEVEGKLQGDAAIFDTGDAKAEVKNGELTITHGEKKATLKKTERTSPTLGAKPPEGAIVLFDGKSADAFAGGKMTDDKLLMVGTQTKQGFKDFVLHLEFRTPFMPTSEGQARGNSGVYLQNRYEVQVLDSFGLEGRDNECGGLYSVKEPDVNMCLPPLSWQTYDVDFTAPKFEGDKKVKNARLTIRHNGVKIYDDFELPKLTPGGEPKESASAAPLSIQNHGNPVVFRNIWILEKK